MSDTHGSNQHPLQAMQEEPSSKRTLLYVEDNPANMILVGQLIARRNDLKLITAINGNLGIILARSFQPAVILMDINLPGISGFEVLALLRANPLTSHIPVIALSSMAFPHDIKKGMEAGFLRYLTKPYQLDALLDALKVALHHPADMHPSA